MTLTEESTLLRKCLSLICVCHGGFKYLQYLLYVLILCTLMPIFSCYLLIFEKISLEYGFVNIHQFIIFNSLKKPKTCKARKIKKHFLSQ